MAVIAPIAEGTLGATTSEQTLYEYAGYVPVMIKINLTNQPVASVTVIRTYVKALSSDAYEILDETYVYGMPTEPAYDSIYMSSPYGVKWTFQIITGATFNVPYSVNGAH